MTESEAKGFIHGKLDCMNKCDVFNKEDKHRNNECDNCEYCYSQGNFGQQKEAFSVAINALEKQIPNKPKERDHIGFNTLVCPVCKGALYLYEPYCDNCGQKLDWSDEK